MENADWFFKIGDEVCGPVTDAELLLKVYDGKIGRDTLVRKSNQEWTKAERLGSLAGFFPTPISRRIRWGPARVIACIVLLLLFGVWIEASKKIGWVITSVLATLADVPAGPMNAAQARRWAMVDAVIVCILIALGFALGCWVFDRVKKATTETPLGKDNHRNS